MTLSEVNIRQVLCAFTGLRRKRLHAKSFFYKKDGRILSFISIELKVLQVVLQTTYTGEKIT